MGDIIKIVKVPEGSSYACYHCCAKSTPAGYECFQIQGSRGVFWIHNECKELAPWTKGWVPEPPAPKA